MTQVLRGTHWPVLIPKLQSVSAHTRRAPVDPYAEVKAETTEKKLRREVLVASMCREIERQIEQDCAHELYVVGGAL